MIKEEDVKEIGLIASEPDPILGLPVSMNSDEFFKKKTTFLESAKAAFAMESDIVSPITFHIPFEIRNKIVSDFDPFDKEQYDLTGYEEYSEDFANTFNREHADLLKSNIDRQRHYSEILAEDGVRGFSLSVLAGVLSPTMLLPGGTIVKGYKTGANVSRAAITTGAAAAGAVGVSESILHQAQVTRTQEQSAMNITGAAVLGGILGGGVSYFKTGGYLKAAKKLDDALKAEPLDARAVGAMEVRKYSKEQLTPKTSLGFSMRQHILNDLKSKLDNAVMSGNTKLADDITSQIKNIDQIKYAKDVDLFEMVALGPGQRLENSPIEDFRLMGRMLERNTSMIRANDELIGSPISAEAMMNSLWERNHASASLEIGQAYYKYATGVEGAGAIRQKIGGLTDFAKNKLLKQGRKTRTEFAHDVSYAARHGDKFDLPATPEYKQAVEAGARTFRKYADQFVKEGKEVGLFDKDFVFDSITAETWVHRKWNVTKLRDDPNGFANAVIEGMRGPKSPYKKLIEINTNRLSKLNDELAELEDMIKGATPETIDSFKVEIATKKKTISSAEAKLKEATENWKWVQEASDAELRAITDETRMKILGDPNGSPSPRGYTGRSGEFKARTLLIEDDLISDYLENNIEVLMAGMKYRMAPEIEITRAFGTVDIEKSDVFQMARDKYLATLANTKDTLEIKKLNRAWEIGVRDLMAIRDKLLGVYGVPKDPYAFFPRAGYEIRKSNFLAQMGNVVPASISDLGKPVFYYGFKSYGKHLAMMASHPKQWKLAAKDGQKIGHALDLMTHARSLALAEISDPHHALTKFERFTKGASDNFSMINGMDFWNSGHKQFASVMTQDKVLTTALDLKAGKINQKDIAWLASYGLGKEELLEVAEQYLKHGEKLADSLYLSKADIWDNTSISRKYMAATTSIVDDIITSPGKGDMPNILGGTVGKLIAQFNSFNISSVRRTLQTGLQRHDATVLQGITAMMFWGAVSYGVSQWLRGEEINEDKIIYEAFDRSGLMGAYWSYPMMLNRSLGDPAGLNLSRYRRQPQFGTLLGPSVGNLERAWDIGGNVLSGQDLSDTNIHKMRQLLWFQNLFYTRWLFDHLEENMKEAN